MNHLQQLVPSKKGAHRRNWRLPRVVRIEVPAIQLARKAMIQRSVGSPNTSATDGQAGTSTAGIRLAEQTWHHRGTFQNGRWNRTQ